MEPAFAELTRSLEIANDDFPFGIFDDQPWECLSEGSLYRAVRAKRSEITPREILRKILRELLPPIYVTMLVHTWEKRGVVPLRLACFINAFGAYLDELGVPEYVPSAGV